MMAVFSRLVPCITSAYALQSFFALLFVPSQTDKYYDLGGALGFLSTTLLSLYYPSLYYPSLKAKYYFRTTNTLPPLSLTSFAPRQLLISAMLGVWSVRLGTFLAARAIKSGGDSRFDEIKKDPVKFTGAWMAQATWITLVGLPVYLVNTLPKPLHPALGVKDYLAAGLYVGSLAFEAVADRQKTKWREGKERKDHEEKFVKSGLWSVSRHPNYVGEVGIWTGIWAMSASSLMTPYFPKGMWFGAAISPLMTYVLVRHASGVPLLEQKSDEKFKDDPEWTEYKRTVPIFWPWGGGDKV